MRIWDVHPKYLCRQHLLGEHRELHGMWNIFVLDKSGYRMHPETRRWEGKLGALYYRHEALVKEMLRRGYRHMSPLDKKLARGTPRQRTLILSVEEQFLLLRSKGCDCSQKEEVGIGGRQRKIGVSKNR